jgi:GNAT superfamily N-acetyltransferase
MKAQAPAAAWPGVNPQSGRAAAHERTRPAPTPKCSILHAWLSFVQRKRRTPAPSRPCPGRIEEIRALVREQASLAALEHGQIVGFLALRPGHFYGGDFIDLLFVAPGWRRHGTGRALIQAALRRASTSRVFTSTNESNTPMRELLRSEGWTPSGGAYRAGRR